MLIIDRKYLGIKQDTSIDTEVPNAVHDAKTDECVFNETFSNLKVKNQSR